MLGAGINTAVVMLEVKEMSEVRMKGIVRPNANINWFMFYHVPQV